MARGARERFSSAVGREVVVVVVLFAFRGGWGADCSDWGDLRGLIREKACFVAQSRLLERGLRDMKGTCCVLFVM